MTTITKRFTVEEGRMPVGDRGPLDVADEWKRLHRQLLLARPRAAETTETPEEREARIKLDPLPSTPSDVHFLLRQLEEARAEQAVIVARLDSNCAVAAAVDVEAWISARLAPRSDWIGALNRDYFPPV